MLAKNCVTENIVCCKFVNKMLSKIYCRNIFFLRKISRSCNPLASFSYFNNKLERSQNNFGENGGSSLKFGTFALLVGVGTGYLLKNQLCMNEISLGSYFGLQRAYCATKGNVYLREKFNFIADVVEDAAESVVYVEILDSGRHRLFQGGPVTISNGSGFIIQPDGLILTNAHVVVQHRPSAVRVRLMDGRTFEGHVESVDMQSDLATIRIKADNLPVMKLGTSGDLRPGEWVVAIGSPLTLSNTVTAGVVSAAQRPGTQLGIPHSGINYIQTDASITFGNSGGPLVNLDGEAIGINSIKITAGISFAIPIDYAKEFLSKNQSKSKPSQPGVGVSKKFIGITMVTLKPEFIYALHARGLLPLDVTSGILVWKVSEGGPAYRSGLRPGDVMTHVNGEPVQSVQQIYEALDKHNKISIRAMRNGHPMDLEVMPEEI